MIVSRIRLISLILISLNSVKVNSEPRECKVPGCPDVLCNLIKSRETDFCKDIQCNGLEQKDCPLDSLFRNGLTMCGCCPGCAKYIDEGQPCEVSQRPPSIDPNCTDPFCPILMNECKPGLDCKYLGENSKVCAPPVLGAKSPLEDQCEYKRILGLTSNLHWTPNCDLDGSYAPKQCKGTPHDGSCFCVDPTGKRIFGREWRVQAENQTCACSRHVFHLRNAGHIATIHCSSDGNYESLQCDTDSGLCYCVDPVTGKLDGSVLPEHQWKLLPCYSTNITNGDPTGQYLRQCESEWGIGQRIRREAILHGVDVYAVADSDCDYDGSFKAVRRLKSQDHCVPKNGVYQENDGKYGMRGLFDMNCQCFRDAILHREEEKPFSKLCELETGNYSKISVYNDVSTKEYKCVDVDGFFYPLPEVADPVPEAFACCLLGDCSRQPDHIKEKCYDSYTGNGIYKSCQLFPT